MIDSGMIVVSLTSNKLFEVKDFACDRLVLDLCSADTVSKILNLEDEDPVTNITLCLTLYFMRVHLFAVNCKGQLSANERIVMLWSSLIFMIHIDGAFITTKRNLINECIRYDYSLTFHPKIRLLTVYPEEVLCLP